MVVFTITELFSSRAITRLGEPPFEFIFVILSSLAELLARFQYSPKGANSTPSHAPCPSALIEIFSSKIVSSRSHFTN